MSTIKVESLARLFKKSEEFISALKDDKGEWKSEGERDKIAEEHLLKHISEQKEQQLKRGHREKGEELDKALKKETGFKGDLTGEKLIKEAVKVIKTEQKVKEVEVKVPMELTEATIRENPKVIKIAKEIAKQQVESVVKDLSALQEELVEEKVARKKDADEAYTKLVRDMIAEKTESVLTSMNARLDDGGEDEEARLKMRTQRLSFLLGHKDFDPKNFRLGEGNTLIPIDAQNLPLEDKYGKEITFKAYVKPRNPYSYHDQDPGNGSFSPNSQGKKTAFKGNTTSKEILAKLAKTTDLKVKDSLLKQAAELIKQEQEK